jgi:hypothetical protein
MEELHAACPVESPALLCWDRLSHAVYGPPQWLIVIISTDLAKDLLSLLLGLMTSDAMLPRVWNQNLVE